MLCRGQLHEHWSALPGAAEGALLSPGACDVAGPGRMLLQQALSQHGPFCVSGRQASSSKLSDTMSQVEGEVLTVDMRKKTARGT